MLSGREEQTRKVLISKIQSFYSLSLQHIIGFLGLLSVLFTGAGLAALVVRREFRAQYKFAGLFIISKSISATVIPTVLFSHPSRTHLDHRWCQHPSVLLGAGVQTEETDQESDGSLPSED